MNFISIEKKTHPQWVNVGKMGLRVFTGPTPRLLLRSLSAGPGARPWRGLPGTQCGFCQTASHLRSQVLPSGAGREGKGGSATANLLSTGRREEHSGRLAATLHPRGPKTRYSQVQQVPGTDHEPWHGVHAHAPSGAGNKPICRLRQGDSEQSREDLCLQSSLATQPVALGAPPATWRRTGNHKDLRPGGLGLRAPRPAPSRQWHPIPMRPALCENHCYAAPGTQELPGGA